MPLTVPYRRAAYAAPLSTRAFGRFAATAWTPPAAAPWPPTWPLRPLGRSPNPMENCLISSVPFNLFYAVLAKIPWTVTFNLTRTFDPDPKVRAWTQWTAGATNGDTNDKTKNEVLRPAEPAATAGMKTSGPAALDRLRPLPTLGK